VPRKKNLLIDAFNNLLNKRGGNNMKERIAPNKLPYAKKQQKLTPNAGITNKFNSLKKQPIATPKRRKKTMNSEV